MSKENIKGAEAAQEYLKNLIQNHDAYYRGVYDKWMENGKTLNKEYSLGQYFRVSKDLLPDKMYSAADIDNIMHEVETELSKLAVIAILFNGADITLAEAGENIEEAGWKYGPAKYCLPGLFAMGFEWEMDELVNAPIAIVPDKSVLKWDLRLGYKNIFSDDIEWIKSKFNTCGTNRGQYDEETGYGTIVLLQKLNYTILK